MRRWSVFLLLNLFILLEAVPKDYAKKPGLSKFQFAKDVSSRNYRKQDKCGIDIVLNWKKEVQSSCYSTPVAFQLFHEEYEDIIVNGFWKYIDVINQDGLSFESWPKSLEDNRFYSSPIIFDLDKNGKEDIITIDDEGIIRVLTMSNLQTIDHISMFTLPTLAIDRFWYDKYLEITDVSIVQQYTHLSFGDSLQTRVLFKETEIQKFKEQKHTEQYQNYISNSFQHVHLDAHVVGDVGKFIDITHLILYIPISYYLSDDDYPNGLPSISFDKYEACGVTAVDLSTNTILWSLILGVSTHYVSNRATIFSTPVTVDLEGLGQLTTLFGTSQGYLYAVTSQGIIRPGFPVHFGPIEMGVVCADIANDSYLEIIVGDLNGNLAVLDSKGDEVWSVILSSGISHNVVIGDVNGDGQLDVVAVTKTGDCWVFNGQTGESLKNFPIKLGCSIHSSPLLLQLDSIGNGLSIVLISKEGELFIINGKSGCITRLDLNEEVFARILAIENENELISLIISTMNSNVIKLTTSGPWRQLNSFSNNDLNLGYIYLPQYNAIEFGDGKKQWIDVIANHVQLPIHIIDERKNKYNHYYKVSIIRKGEILYQNTFYESGKYILEFDIQETGYFNLILLFENEHRQVMNVNINVHANIEGLYYLKWIILIPIILISTLLFCSSNLGSPLPL